MPLPVFHVEAFTAKRFAGHPAAVCLLAAWLDDGVLQAVATENNLSETAFLVPSGNGPQTKLLNQSLAAQEFVRDVLHIAVLAV
jgi:PhzF family phenazine biosynthesis protein